MPKVSETYSGQYLTASELKPPGQHRYALVRHVAQELIGQDKAPKLVLSLVSTAGHPWPKDCVLNKTNALQLQAAYGDDTEAWSGKRIEIWAENVMFQGRVVPGIKVMPSPDGHAAEAVTTPPPSPPRSPPPMPTSPVSAVATVGSAPVLAASVADIDDDIPY